MEAAEERVAFISRNLWLARGEPRFGGHIESEAPTARMLEEGPGWGDVEEAISWGRARAPEVYVRLGATGATYYSAGADDPPRDPDYPDDEMLRWPPTKERIASDLATIARDPHMLGPPEFRDWVESVHELGALRVKQAADPLLLVLTTDNHRVMDAAAVALYDIGDPRAVERLAKELATASSASEDRLIALEVAAQVLSCFDDPAAREAAAEWYSRDR